MNNDNWIIFIKLILDIDIGNYSNVVSNNNVDNELFNNICPICQTEIIQIINDNKGNHPANCKGIVPSRRIMHDTITVAFMGFLKSVGIVARKEPHDVLTRDNNQGGAIVPDIFIQITLVVTASLIRLWIFI